jgi:hypothetical protein
MKRLIVVSTMCACMAAGAFAGNAGSWVLDVSGNVTSLSGVQPTGLPEPAVPPAATIAQTAVKGYLIVDTLSGIDDTATFVLVNSNNKTAVFEYNIPIMTWNNGKIAMVLAELNPLMMVVTYGSVSINGATLKSLALTGAATSSTWFDANGNSTPWPAYGSVSLRNDSLLSAAALKSGNSGEEVVQAYLGVLKYSMEFHYNNP